MDYVISEDDHGDVFTCTDCKKYAVHVNHFIYLQSLGSPRKQADSAMLAHHRREHERQAVASSARAQSTP
jgi:hypothetical protein